MHDSIISTTDDPTALATSDRPSKNPALVFLANRKSVHTRRNMTRYLGQIASGVLVDDWKPNKDQHHALIAGFPWHGLRFEHVSAIMAKLTDLYSPATVNVMLSAMRGVLKTAYRLNLIPSDDYQKAIDVENIKYDTIPAGRDVGSYEVTELLRTCNVNAKDRSRKDTRDGAIIALMVTLGLRRSEVSGLKLVDYDADTGQVKIIGAKGRKDRTAYISNTPRILLERWLAIRGDHQGKLFEHILKGDKFPVSRKGITDQAIYNLLKDRMSQVSDVVKDFSPHDLRRTAVGNMLDAGIDMSTVANIVGHSSTDTTKRYDRRGERVKIEASKKMDIEL